MTFDKLKLLWARYEELDRLAAQAEGAGDEQKHEQIRQMLAHCAQLIAAVQAEDDE